MSNLCVIVGAGDMRGTDLHVPNNAFVIAADGGLEYLQKRGITPNLIMGDFDSLGSVPGGENVMSFTPEKNDTDTMIAVKKALQLGFEIIVIYGGLGGRFDHSIANIQTLTYIANHGAAGYLIGCGNVCTVVKDGAIAFSGNMSGIISVFSVTEISTGVNLRGLKYPLEEYVLTSDFPLGVSNEFMAAPATVSVEKGALAVIWSGSSYSPEDYRRQKAQGYKEKK